MGYFNFYFLRKIFKIIIKNWLFICGLFLITFIIFSLYNHVSAVSFPSTDNINGYKLVVTQANIGSTFSPVMYVCENYKIMFNTDKNKLIVSARYQNPNASGTIKLDEYKVVNGAWTLQRSETGSTTLNPTIRLYFRR